MGLLRLLFALGVVADHTGSFLGSTAPDGVTAVQSFYILSGFYMALVLGTKYAGPGSYRLFLSNRLLRLLPAYWVVLALAIPVSLTAAWQGIETPLAYYVLYASRLPASALAALGLSSLALFGQDAVMFLQVTPAGQLAPTLDFQTTSPPLWRFLFVPQAWTLGVELTFYLVAPIILRWRTRYVLSLVVASLGLRAVLYSTGLSHDPWTYRFFPTELALFLAGSLAYRLYRATAHLWATRRGRSLALALTLSLWAATATFRLWVPGETTGIQHSLWYLLLALSLPAIFATCRNWRLDRLTGELSYPVYISHLLAYSVALLLIADSPLLGDLAALLSLLVALAWPKLSSRATWLLGTASLLGVLASYSLAPLPPAELTFQLPWLVACSWLVASALPLLREHPKPRPLVAVDADRRRAHVEHHPGAVG